MEMADEKKEREPLKDAHKMKLSDYKKALKDKYGDVSDEEAAEQYVRDSALGTAADLTDPNSRTYQALEPKMERNIVAKKGYVSKEETKKQTEEAAAAAKAEMVKQYGLTPEKMKELVEGQKDVIGVAKNAWDMEVEDLKSAISERDDAVKEGYIYENGNEAICYEEEMQLQKDIDAIWDAYEKNERDAGLIINKEKELSDRDKTLTPLINRVEFHQKEADKAREAIGADYERLGKERQQVEADRLKAEQMLAAAEEKEKEVETARGEIGDILTVYEGLPDIDDYQGKLDEVRAANKEAEALVGQAEPTSEAKGQPDALVGVAPAEAAAQKTSETPIDAAVKAWFEEEESHTPEQIADAKRQIEDAYKAFEPLEGDKKTVINIKANLATAKEALAEGSLDVAMLGINRAYLLMETLKGKNKWRINTDLYNKHKEILEPYIMAGLAAGPSKEIILIATEEDYNAFMKQVSDVEATEEAAEEEKAPAKPDEIEGGFEEVKETAAAEKEAVVEEEYQNYLDAETAIYEGLAKVKDIQKRLEEHKANKRLFDAYKNNFENIEICIERAMGNYEIDNIKDFFAEVEDGVIRANRLDENAKRPGYEMPAETEAPAEPQLDEATMELKKAAEKDIKMLESTLNGYDMNDARTSTPRRNLKEAKEAFDNGNYQVARSNARLGRSKVSPRKPKPEAKPDAKKETEKKTPADKKKDEGDEDLDVIEKEIDEDFKAKHKKK